MSVISGQPLIQGAGSSSGPSKGGGASHFLIDGILNSNNDGSSDGKSEAEKKKTTNWEPGDDNGGRTRGE